MRLRESRTLGGREGRREEGLCRTLTCLSVAVTLRGHRCESRAQLHGSPSDSRSHSPTHPSPPQHVLPPDTQFTLPGGPSTGTHCRDAHSTATVTHLVTPALARSHAEPTLLTQRVPPRLHCPPATSTQMSPSSRAELAPHPRILDITALCGLLVPRPPGPFPFLLSPSPVISHLALAAGFNRSHPPSVSVLSHLFKMQIWYCHSLLKPCGGFLCPQAKACRWAPAAEPLPRAAPPPPPSLTLPLSSRAHLLCPFFGALPTSFLAETCLHPQVHPSCLPPAILIAGHNRVRTLWSYSCLLNLKQRECMPCCLCAQVPEQCLARRGSSINFC